MSGDCLFCKIVRKEIPSEVVYEDEDFFAFRDINPKAPVHVLFVPKVHIDTLNAVEGEKALLVGRMFEKIKEVAKAEGISEEGYRVVGNCNLAAGQEVFHLHFHLLGGRKLTWPPG